MYYNTNNLHNFLSTFIAISKVTQERVVMKLEDPNNEASCLPLEVQVYEDLQKSKARFCFIHIRSFKTLFFPGAANLLDKGFPNLVDYGFYDNKRVLIMSQLGPDLLENAEQKQISLYVWDELRFIATNAVEKSWVLIQDC